MVLHRSAFFRHQNFSLASMVGRTDDALLLHLLNKRGCAVIADGQATLDIAGRGLAITDYDVDRLVIQCFSITRLAIAPTCGFGLISVGVLRDRLKIVRGSLQFEVRDNLLDLFVRDEGAMDTLDASRRPPCRACRPCRATVLHPFLQGSCGCRSWR